METASLGSRIRKERKGLGLTLEKFAALVGTSKAMLQRVETGAKSPSIALLAEIATVCRRRIDDFIQKIKGLFQSFKNMGTLLRLFQIIKRPPYDNFTAMGNKLF